MQNFKQNPAVYKYIKQVNLSFNPFDPLSKSFRKLITPLTNEQIKKVNESFQLNLDISSSIKEPKLTAVYQDGAKQEISDVSLSLSDLESQLTKPARELQQKDSK